MNAATVTSAAGETLRVTARGPVLEAAHKVTGRLWVNDVPRRLAEGDPELWRGPAEADPREVLAKVAALTERPAAAGLTEVVLLGSGGPALAAAAMDRCGAHRLTVLDTLDPGPVQRVVDDPSRLRRTVVVVAGDTPANRTLRGVFEAAFEACGVTAEDHFLVLADREPSCFGALSEHALVPAALAGVDVAGLVEEARAELEALARQEDNPGLALGAIIGGCARPRDTPRPRDPAGTPNTFRPRDPAGAPNTPRPRVPAGAPTTPRPRDPAHPGDTRRPRDTGGTPDHGGTPDPGRPRDHSRTPDPASARDTVRAPRAPRTGDERPPGGRDKAVIAAYPPLAGLGPWIANLLSTIGVLPIVQDGGFPIGPADDRFLIAIGGRPEADDATVSGPLGAQFAVWEYATAVAAYLLGVPADGPTDGPAHGPTNGEADEEARVGVVEENYGVEPLFSEGGTMQKVDVHASADVLNGATDLAGVIDTLMNAVPEDGYLTIMSYMDPDPGEGQATAVRRLAATLAARTNRVVTLGHGVPRRGVHLLITGNAVHESEVHGFGLSRVAEAINDARRLEDRGRPVVRLHLNDRWAGLAQLLTAAQGGQG